LLDEGIIEETRKVGKTQFHKLNLDNHVARLLLILENLIIKQKLERKIIIETLEPRWNLVDTTIFQNKTEAPRIYEGGNFKKKEVLEIHTWDIPHPKESNRILI